MQAGEIGVNVAINGKVASGTNDSAFVGSAMQVSDDGLDGSGVTLLWAVVEACNLTDSEGDVRSSIRRDRGAFQRWKDNSRIHCKVHRQDRCRVEVESLASNLGCSQPFQLHQ